MDNQCFGSDLRIINVIESGLRKIGVVELGLRTINILGQICRQSMLLS